MNTPKRMQRFRLAGWSMQVESLNINGLPAVSVCRPGKWGNPYPVGKPGLRGTVASDAEGATGLFKDMFSDPELRKEAGYPNDAEIREKLAGKNLACFCALDQPCHADVLIELANEVQS